MNYAAGRPRHALPACARSLLVALIALLPAAGQAADPLEAEMALLLKPPNVELVRISPTGRYLAVTTYSDRGRRLLVHDREKDTQTVNYDLAHENAISSMEWVTDNLIMVQQIRRNVLGGFFGSAELFTINARGGRLKRIGRGEVIDILDGKRAVLVSISPDRFSEVQRLDVRGGSQRRVARSPSPRARFLPDADGKIRFSIGESANARQVIHVREGREWKLLASTALDETGWEPWWFAGPGKYYTRTSEGDDATTWGLGLYDLETETHTLLLRHPKTDVTDLLFDFSQQNVVAVGYELHYPGWRYVNAKHPLALLHGTLRKTFDTSTVRIVSTTRDHTLAVVEVSSDVNPGDLYLANTATRQLDKLYTRRPDLADRTFAPMSAVEITARDGATLYGYTTSHPETPVPGPMVVLVHGGPYGIRDRWGFNGQVQLLASRGYHVLQVNYRGSGGYGVDYMAAGFGEWGGLMQDDLTDATRWATEPGSAGSPENPELALAQADKICIMGTSYGAYAALMGPIKAPGLYRCAAGTSGVYDMTLMKARGDVRRTRAGEAYLRHVIGQSKEALEAISPTYRADEIKVPVLLIHGEQDFRAPIAHANGLRRALTAAGNPPTWRKLSGEGHETSQLRNILASYADTFRFLAEHLDNE